MPEALLLAAPVSVCCQAASTHPARARLALYLLPPRAFNSTTGFWLALLAGAVTALALAARTPGPRHLRATAALAPLLLVAAVLPSTPRFMRPQVAHGDPTAPALGWLEAQPVYRSGDHPVVSNWRPDGRLAGPRLAHPVVLLPRGTPCDRVAAMARSTWVVFRRDIAMPVEATPAEGERCFRGRRPAFGDFSYAIYTGLS